MVTYHRGARCRGTDKDVNSHIDNAEYIDIGPDNDNKGTNSSDTATAFGALEADGCPKNLLPSYQAKLTVLMREIHSL